MDKIETLYNSLKDSGDYTKSFESFKSQFGTEQGIKSLHSALSSSGDYTKSLNDFKNQFFTESPLVTKKKSQRVSVGGFSFPTEQKQEDSEPTATKLQGGTLGDRFKKDNFQFDSNKARLEIAQNNIENLTQDESSIYESYLNYTELDPSDIDSAKKEVATPKDKGFFSGVSDGVRNSFIVKSIFGEAEKEKEITLDDLLDKKQRQKRIDFFKTLDSPEKRKEIHAIIELHKFKTDAERKVSENKVLDLHDGIRKLSNQKKELNDKLKSINDSAKYAKTPEELDVLKQQFELINVESQNIEKKGLDTLTLADGLFKKIQSLDNKIGSFEEELNLSKRNYQSGIDALDRLDIGFEQIGANLDYLGRNAFNNLKRNIGIIDGNDFNSNKENIDLGAFQDRDNLQNKREFFTPQKEFSDLNSTSDYFDFVTGTLIDTTPVLAELSLGAPGVALFIAENQQGNTIDIKKGVFDKNKELNNVNELLSKGELSDSEKNKFETRKKQIEDAPELSPVGIFLTASAKTGVEFAFSTIGKFRILTKNRRVLKSLVKNGVKTEIKEGVKKSLSKKLLSGTFNFVKDATGEGLEEYGNQIFNNFLDINVLGDKFNVDGTRKTLLDGALEAGAGGLGVGFIISSPIVGVKVVSEISTQNTLSKLSKNALEINSLYDKLNNEGISKSTRKILKESANSLLIENERLLRKDLDGFDKLDKVKKQNYLDIVRKELGVKDAINELGNSDKSLVSKLQGQLKVLDGQKIDLFQEIQDVKIYKEGIETVNKEGISNVVPTPHKPINDVSKNINALDKIISDVKDTEKTVDNTKTDEPTNTQDVSQQSLETFKVENQKVETNSNNYIVSIIDGKIDINPEFGTKEVSKLERSKILDNLLKTTNFDVGTRSLDGLSNIDVNQVVDLVESKSQNPKEIAETLLTTDFEITDITGTVDGAIAETLRGGGVDKASLIEVVGSQIEGASSVYFRKVNGKVSTLDVLREKAQELTDNEVTIQDVADFIVNNRSPKDFIEGNTNIKETNLKAKFESLTGLKASKKVLESITGIKEATLQENTISNDVPFQKISTQTSIKGSVLNNLVDRLKQTGLAKKVELLKDNAIKETLVSLGKNVVVTPNGFTDLKTSTVYLNIDKVKLDTPIHEFAEIYMDDIRKTEPKLHQKGIDLISDSKYFNDLKNNEDYKELSDEDLKHEALIQAIGDSGAKILDASTKSEFVDWLTKLFKKVVNSLGIKGLTAKQFEKITLQEYTDLVGAELLSGKSIDIKRKEDKVIVKNNSEKTNVKDNIIPTSSQISKETIDDKISISEREVSKNVDSNLVGIKKELVSEEKQNETEINKKSLSQLFEEGKRLVDDNLINVESLIQSLNNNPRPLSALEVSALVYYKRNLTNKYDNAVDRYEDSIKNNDTDSANIIKEEINVYERLLDEYHETSLLTAYEQGLAFRARQIMLDEDYSMLSQIRKYKAVNNGVIPESVKIKFEEYDKQLKGLNKKLDKLESDKKNLIDILERPKRISKSDFSSIKLNSKNGLDKAVNFIEDLEKQLDDFSKETLGVAIPIIVAKGALKAMKLSIKTVKTTAELIDIGINYVKNSEWYNKLSNSDKILAVDNFKNKILKKKAKKEVKPRFDKIGNLVIPISLIRNSIESGINNIDDLVDYIHTNFDVGESTKREVRDAISNYGKTINLSKDDISKKIREVKRVGKLLSALEDVRKKIRPKRSGLQRDKLTQRERNIKKQINEAIKDIPKTDIEVENAWKSALDKVKDRLKNRIDDLNNQIKNKERTIKERKSIELDQDAKLLKDEAYRLTDVLNSIVPKVTKNMSYETKVNLIVKSLEKSISDYKTKIKNKDFESIRKSPSKIQTKEINSLRSKRDKLKKELDNLKKKEGFDLKLKERLKFNRLKKRIETLNGKIISKRIDYETKNPTNVTSARIEKAKNEVKKLNDILNGMRGDSGLAEKRRTEMFKRRTSRLIDEYTRRIKEGDFAPKEFKQVNFDEEAKKLEAEKILVKNQFDLEREKARLKNRTFNEKFIDRSIDVINIPRALMASADFSAVLRQGAMLSFRNPIKASKALVEMFKQTFSQISADEWLAEVKTTDGYILGKKAGLFLAEPNTKLIAKEEEFMSNISEKIPVWGIVIRGSGRAYAGYLNKLRHDIFIDFADKLILNGYNPDTDIKPFKDIASFVNNATGRGELGFLEKAAPIINGLMFSPRYVASRINLMNPVKYAKMNPLVRKEALITMFTYVGTGLIILSLAKLAGADVEDDPRSSDFAKIKIGNTRLDIWAGFQQWIRLFSQIITKKSKSTTTGRIHDLDPSKFGGKSRGDLLLKFGRSKLAPVSSLTVDILQEKDMIGQDIQYPDRLIEMLVPLYAQDINDILKEHEVIGAIPIGVASLFGIGVQNYTPKKKRNDKNKNTQRQIN